MALHAVALFLVSKVGLEVARAVPPHADSKVAVEFEIESANRMDAKDEQGAAPAARDVESSTSERAKGASRGRNREASRPDDAPESPQRESTASSEPRAEDGAVISPNGYSLDPSAPPRDSAPSASQPSGQPPADLAIGPGDWSRFVDPSAAPKAERSPAGGERSTSHAPPVSTTGGLAEALEAHDQAVGLGRGGPVLSAAHEAAHSDVAPALGTAVFAITVLASGAVHVEVTSASSSLAGWQQVATRMSEEIAKRPPVIRSPRLGVHLNLELRAVEQWPNGAPAKSEGLSVSVSGKIRSTDEAKESLAARNPLAVPPPGSPAEQRNLTANVDLPGVWVGARGKVCGFRVGVTPLGPMLQGGCDLSNLGAKPQRVVSARITAESMF